MENLSFEKIIYNISDFKGKKVNILLKIETISNIKCDNRNCDAEIYDSKGRYFYCYKLYNNYDYYYNLYLNNNFKIVYDVFDGDYCIFIDGGGWGDIFPLSICENNLESIERELKLLEEELENKRTEYNNFKKIIDTLL